MFQLNAIVYSKISILRTKVRDGCFCVSFLKSVGSIIRLKPFMRNVHTTDIDRDANGSASGKVIKWLSHVTLKPRSRKLGSNNWSNRPVSPYYRENCIDRQVGCPLVFGKFLTKNADAEIWSADELWIKNTILKISARYTF